MLDFYHNRNSYNIILTLWLGPSRDGGVLANHELSNQARVDRNPCKNDQDLEDYLVNNLKLGQLSFDGTVRIGSIMFSITTCRQCSFCAANFASNVGNLNP
jgi:hypothetical protein